MRSDSAQGKPSDAALRSSDASSLRSTNHYFSERPASAGGRRVFTAELRGFEIRLATEAGVFSREGVDRGTRLLIKHMEVRPTDRFLDLGCGYGVVGIVAAKLAPQGQVTLVDINERAVALARENLSLNEIGNAEALQGDGLAPVSGRVFDVIALNPPIRAGLAVVYSLIEQARGRLAGTGTAGFSLPASVLTLGSPAEACATRGGEASRFYLVGRTKQGVLRIGEKMRQVYGNAEEVAKGGGYRVYLSVL
jgi:16S rRNA (guanine1207-N2)-methyltransferase